MWETVDLKTLCEINMGKTPSRSNPEYWSEDETWVSISDLKGEKYISQSKEGISRKAVTESNIRKVKEGTLLYSFKLSIGKVAITKKDLYTNEAIVALPIKDTNKLHLDYLYYAIQNVDLTGIGDKAVKGITLNKDKLERLKIPLPPLHIQKQIADTLDKADALRQKDQQLLQKCNDLAQSIFYEMFGDPVRNEKGWEKEKLSSLGSLERGVSKHRPRNAPDLLGGPFPLIQTGDVANSNGIITSYKTTYSELGLKQSKLWKKGTLCITIAANIAKTGILGFDACFPDSVVGFTPYNNKTNTIFIQTWLSFLQKTLEDTAPESAQKNINLDILRNLQVICPPYNLMERFKNMIDQLRLIRDKSLKSSYCSEKLFNSCLNRYLLS